MRNLCFTVARWAVLVGLSVLAASVHAQVATANSQTPTLEDFFESVQANPPHSPNWDEIKRVQVRTQEAPANEVAKGLTVVMASLLNSNDTIQRYAGLALIAVSTRPDSAQLLRPYISQLADLLNSPKDYLRRGGVAIFAMLKPALPLESVAPLLVFVKRTDRDTEAQVGALSILLRAKPEDEAVIQTVEEFMSRPLDRSTRVTALNAIHTSRANDIRIQKIVIGSLEDPHPGVELAAIAALDRMGPLALAKAKPALTRLSTNENPDVSAAARKAMKSLQGETH